MNWQDFAALGIVAAAAAWLAGCRWRRRKRLHSCGGCPATASAPGHASSIVFQARRGQPPVITVKMK